MSEDLCAPIDLSLCLPGVDLFGILGRPDVFGAFVGEACGMTMLQAPDIERPLLVLPGKLIELGPVISNVSYVEFHAGYADGIDQQELGMPISTRLMGRIPSDHGRGFSIGAADAKNKVFRRSEWAYNECCRYLRMKYSAVHTVRYPASQADKILALGIKLHRATIADAEIEPRRKIGGGDSA